MRCSLAVPLLIATVAAPAAAEWTVARQWNEENLAAIRIDLPNPPVHARNLFHVAVAMYDAWAAYDRRAIGYLHHERARATDVGSARDEAVSYAAFRVLRARYASSVAAGQTLAAFDARMDALGYDPSIATTVGESPAAVGNRIAGEILARALDDGSNEAGGYADPNYANDQPVLEVLANGVALGGMPEGVDPDRWQPLNFDQGFTQNGIGPVFTQPYVGVTWLNTRAFGLRRFDPDRPWFDPGPPPRLRGGDPQQYMNQALELLQKSQQLGDLERIDISPGARGNHLLGTDDGAGRPLNPVSRQPYEPQWVPRGDFGRVIAEFWADGPDSETPPGHWHTIANQVSDALPEKRIGGRGPVISDLEWDVKLYFALAGATHDAACAAWSVKRFYESPRPITMVRFMAHEGQSSDPSLPSYSAEGLPLVPGLVEVVTPEALEPGGSHEGSGFEPGAVIVRTWPGVPSDASAQRNLPRWIRGVDWIPYQSPLFVSPAFPGYISGHSTFSRAAAEVLTAMTGSEYFPGGLGGFTAEPSFLRFEFGPSQVVHLQWATYYDAADEAGISRRWGGIHPKADDLPGRVIGASCGKRAYFMARRYWDGSIARHGDRREARRRLPIPEPVRRFRR